MKKNKSMGLKFRILDGYGNEIAPETNVYFDERYSRQPNQQEKETQELNVVIRSADNTVLVDTSKNKNEKNRKRNEFKHIKLDNNKNKKQQKEEVMQKQIPIINKEEQVVKEEKQIEDKPKSKFSISNLTLQNRFMMIPEDENQEEQKQENTKEEEYYPSITTKSILTTPKLSNFDNLPESLKGLINIGTPKKKEEQKEQPVPNGVYINNDLDNYEKMAQELGLDTDGDLPRNEKFRKNRKGGEF